MLKINELEAVLFDYNGTMVFDYEVNVLAWNKLMHENGVLDFDYRNWWGIHNIVILKHYLKDKYDLDYLYKLSALKEVYYRDIASKDPNYKLVDGCIEFIELLEQHKIKKTIVTASIKDNVDFYFKHNHLDKYFDQSLVVYDDGSNKDKVSMYKKAFDNLNVNSSKGIIIDDSLVGIKSAKSLNPYKVIAILSKPDTYNQDKIEISDYAVNDFVELGNMLE